MEIIHGHLHHWPDNLPAIPLKVPRSNLAKRRWRGVAEDGTEFGFDVDHALDDGDTFHHSASVRYVIEQQPEPVIEIPLPPQGGEAARLGWLIGNLHFQLEVTPSHIRVVDDPAVRQLLDRLHLHYHPAERIFHPLTGGHTHHHGHEH